MSAAGPASNSGTAADAATIFGTNRDTIVNKLNGAAGPIVQFLAQGGTGNLNTPLNVLGTMRLIYDGTGDDPLTVQTNGLGGANFGGGTNRFDIQAGTDLTGAGSQIRITIFDSTGASANVTRDIVVGGGLLQYPFSSFAGVNMSSVGAIVVDVINVPAAGDVEIDFICATTVADLSLTKTVSAGPHNFGELVTFTVTLNNAGPNPVGNVTVGDVLPAGLTFDSAVASQGTYNAGTGVWSLNTPVAVGNQTLAITARITGSGTIRNYAQVLTDDGVDADSTPGDNSGRGQAGDPATQDDDDAVSITVTAVDFGDAPATYGTQLGAGTGARHAATGPRLGANRDTENDGQPNATATGDDSTGTPDDEDGVTISSLFRGSPVSVPVSVTNGTGFLNAWVDVNLDGDFTDAGEQIVTNVAVAGGTNFVTFTLPAGTTLGANYARFRVTSASVGTPSPTGFLPSGEVEDYQFTVVDQAPDLALQKDVSNATPTVGDIITYTVTVTNESATVTATGVSVRDVLPAGVTFQSSTPSQGTYTAATGVWDIGTLNPAQVVTLGITVQVTGSGTITNSAEVRTTVPGDTDSVPGNNSVNEDDDDDAVIVVPAVDFGDAPNSYGTLLANDGARHVLSGPTLGTNRDSEGNGQPNAGSNGDDNTGTPDDEDGVTFPTFANGAVLTRGLSNTIAVNSSAAGFLNAWLDLNLDGDFSDAGEQIFTNQAVVAGANNLNYTVPGSATLGTSYARFRLTSASVGTPLPTGLSPDGEVEDYVIPIVERADLSLTKIVSNPAPHLNDTIVYTITVNNAGPQDATNVTVRDVLPTGVVYQSHSGGSYNDVSGVWTIGTLVNGGNAVLQITARVVASGNPIDNYAQLRSADQFDPDSIVNNGSTNEDDDDTARIVVDPEDFGDAPDGPYPTLLATNGARHVATGVNLGATRDSENQGQPNGGASGDGADEDGVTGIAILTQDVNNQITINASGAGFINAWIDFNADGDWNDVGEQIITNGAVISGNNNFNVNPGLLASPNVNTFARFRITDSAVATPLPTGLLLTGEVEDYSVLIRQVADLSLTKQVNNAAPLLGDNVVYTITVTNGGPNGATGVAVRDLLPAGVVYVSDNSAATGTTYSSGTGVWTIGNLANGASIALQITVNVQASGNIDNYAQISASNQFDNDSTPNDGSSTQDDDDTARITVPTVDFGDAPDPSFPTLLANNGARHLATGPTLGASRDTEDQGQQNGNATGDGADENGVSTLTLTIGTTQTITVNSSGAGFVNAWIDYNQDGDWNDGGEQVLANRPVVAGDNFLVVNIPLNATPGQAFGRFRLTSTSVVSPAVTGTLPDGEVEDYQLTLQRLMDFGDAPNTYGTTVASSGAGHVAIGVGPYLGVNPPDVDVDGQPASGGNPANLDDNNGTPDDEDGVTFPPLRQGEPASITVVAPLGGRLDAFIDYNQDGDFTDAGEQVTVVGGTLLSPGNNSLNITLPANAITGNTYARFRISTGGGVGPTGFAADGEVEDFQVVIEPGLGSISDRVWFDHDGDGVQDAVSPSEPGLAGVGIAALWAGPNGNFGDGDDQTFNTVTGANGIYLFADVPVGNYRVTVTGATLPNGLTTPTFDRDGTPNGTTDLTLAPTQDLTDVDFGYRGALSLGDRVWYDLNNNGAQDFGEPGLSATVTLQWAGVNGTFGDADDFVTTTPTGFDGIYGFGNLGSGNYRVTVNSGTLLNAIDTPTFDLDGTGTPHTTAVTLNASRTDVDFGYRGLLNLGNRVWYDHNINAAQDAGELGLVGVSVTLLWAGPDSNFGTGDDVTIGTTATGANGIYNFANLGTGNYRATVTSGTLPNGISTPTFDLDGVGTPHVATVNNLITERSDVDFGYRGTATLGDRVWYDQDADGVQDAASPSEPGISGVTVTLIWGGQDGNVATAGDNLTLTTTTGANGVYGFINLASGAYRVSTTPGTLPNGLTVQTFDLDGLGTANQADTTLALAQNRTDVDFGYRGTATLGDRVWYDQDGDGVQDANEPGISGVTLDLIWGGQDGNLATTADNLTLSVVTAANGAYSVGNLASGSYRVTVNGGTLPNGLTSQTFDLDGTATGNSADATLAIGQTRTDVDFGYRSTATLGDRVWLDHDGDGVQDAIEPGMSGVTINLIWAGQDGSFATTADNLTLTTTTGANGIYGFSSLASGSYRVAVSSATLPNGLTVQTFDLDGTGTSDTADTTLVIAQNRIDVDFGYQGTASLGNRLWFDGDDDGVQDAVSPSEPGISGVTVTLVWGGQDGDVNTPADNLVLSTVTGADGVYSFGNLPSGNYRVTVDDSSLPNGITTPTFDLDGTGTADTADATLAIGENRVDGDFGYRGSGSLGDTVWFNPDGDSVKDAGEPGLANVTVTLTWAGQDDDFATTADNYTTTALTSAAGVYGFANLGSGTYRVAVTAGLIAGVAPNYDLDGVATPETADATLGIGQVRTDADFGYIGTAKFNGFVYIDSDNDGVKDPGELPIAGALVRLTGTDILGQVIDRTVATNGVGKYKFTGLLQGTYSITETQPAGFFDGKDAVGTLGGTPSNDAFTGISLPPGGIGKRYNFGELRPASLNGFVYLDLDNDGFRDIGERGIQGVTVRLQGTNDRGQGIDQTLLTGPDGGFAYPNLRPGNYRITETHPSPFTDGIDTIGTQGGTATNDFFSNIVLNEGVNGLENDFGERGLVAGFVNKQFVLSNQKDVDELNAIFAARGLPFRVGTPRLV